MAQLMEYAPAGVGGITGVGGTLALRRTMDVKNGQPNPYLGQPDSILGRTTRPSVVYGVGTGLGAAALVYAEAGFGVDLPEMVTDFAAGHAGGGLASGVASALFPAEAGSGSTSTQTATQSLKMAKAETEDARDESTESSSQQSEYSEAT